MSGPFDFGVLSFDVALDVHRLPERTEVHGQIMERVHYVVD